MGTFTSLGNVALGSTVDATTTFLVPVDQVINTPNCTWDLVDNLGTVFSSGSATSIVVNPTPLNQIVVVEAIVNIPTYLTVNEMGTTYQLRWTLVEGSYRTTVAEQIKVLGLTDTKLGAVDTIELYGSRASVVVNLPINYNKVGFQVYYANDPHVSTLTPIDCSASAIQVSDGYQFRGEFDTASILEPGALLEPYTTIWTYSDGSNGAIEYKEACDFFVITPSLLSSARDLQLLINKARTTSDGMPDSAFSMSELLTFLKMGKDAFNAFAFPTSFTMIKAQGPIKYYWLQFAAISALRAQYLVEGTKAFDFSGQAISLNVDRSQYYESLAASLESAITESCRQLKQQMAKRGISSGDGSQNPNALAYGAIGTVGISLSPISNIRSFGVGNTWWGGGTRIL